MAFADTSTYTLAYAKESTFDQPVAGAGVYKLVRNTGESMNTSLTSAKSDEIDADRQFTGSVHVSGTSAGALNYQMSYAEYDDFLEAVLQTEVANEFSATAYTDAGTGIVAATRTVVGVTSTTGVKVGQIMKLANMVTNTNGIYTVESFVTDTSITFAEAFTVDETVGVAITHNGTIENGSHMRSFTFEKDFKVGGTSNYFVMSGMTAGSMSLSMSTGSIVSGDISFQGATGASRATSKDTGTYLPASTNELMNAVSNVQGLSLTSVALNGAQTAITGVTFQDLSLSIDNGLRDQAQVGSLFAAGIGSSRITVSSSATLYFSNREIFNLFIANDSVQLRFRLADNAGNVYGFVLPEVKIDSHEVTASGADSDIMAAVSLSAIKDTRSGTGKSIIITKINA